ncbi:MAG: tRNA pseudouridine(55) synthase TruB [Bacteroidales bacterium]|nr:tRNA pseudouridine(55) synthase TruB [Bacteroidales bacterium]
MTLEALLEGTVIPVDKPRQWTSFQAVNKVKAAIRNTFDIKKFKIGHAGTLDPLATGLLLICVGKATKCIDELQAGEKVYSGTMVLGATTPCYDLERAIDHYYPYEHITPELVEDVKKQFIGDIEQVPPIFSAVKIGGQRAYQYAREAEDGKEIPSPTPKTVHIDEFEITDFRPGKIRIENEELRMENIPTPAFSHPSKEGMLPHSDNSQSSILNSQLYRHPQGTVPEHLPQINFRIRCGKGTYIRSIARDLGLALDSGAFLSALRREQVGEYTLTDAVSLDDIHSYLFRD